MQNYQYEIKNSLNSLEIEGVKDCKKCYNRQDVPALNGAGSFFANIMLVGLSQNNDCKYLNISFNGKKGEVLTKTLKTIGIPTEEIYITNIIKCALVNSEDNAINKCNCFKFFLNEVKLINPVAIFCATPEVYTFLKSKSELSNKNIVKFYLYKKLKNKQKLQNVYKKILNKKIHFIIFEGADKTGKSTLRNMFTKQYTQTYATLDRSFISNMVYDELYQRIGFIDFKKINTMLKKSIIIYLENSDTKLQNKRFNTTNEICINYNFQIKSFNKMLKKAEKKGCKVIKIDTSQSCDECLKQIVDAIKKYVYNV